MILPQLLSGATEKYWVKPYTHRLTFTSGTLPSHITHSSHPHRTGGIVPIVAAKLHEKNIAGVVRTAIEKSGCGYDDLSHVAVTTGPGLAYSLKAGVDFAKQLAKKIK